MANQILDTHIPPLYRTLVDSSSADLAASSTTDSSSVALRTTAENTAHDPRAISIPRPLARPESSPMAARHLFLASLGNPAPYTNTLHSAGHILLGAIAEHLNLPRFSSSPTLRPGHSTSTPDGHLTLWQSPVQMNISGKPVSTAWKSWLSALPPDARASAKLYIVHDELELSLGKVKIRHTGSAKGHNGLKSVIQAFGGKQDEFSRVGIGIGRPEGRDAADVSRYVLRKCTERERDAIRGAAGQVVQLLELS